MNKAFEKILDRLNEMIHPKQLYFCKYAKGECKHLDNDDKNCAECTVELAKEIVQEVAEEYKGGWIACSERLPDVEADVLLSLRSIDVHTGFMSNTEGYFYVDGEGYVEFENVLAWQPLPQPYKESD